MIKVINGLNGNKTTINIEFKNITLSELICELNIEKTYIGTVLVNGVPKRLTEKLQDGSEIYILPILEGGC